MVMIKYTVLAIAVLVSTTTGDDVGCSETEREGRQGRCTQRGCCRYDYHVTNPDLCDGPNEVCCYQDNICGSGGSCFTVTGTWISRYNHHGSPEAVDAAFAQLRARGINRVQFNVWANGELYYESATARQHQVMVREDRLSWAIAAGQRHNIQVYAWYEYGNQANYGRTMHRFAQYCAGRGWLLNNNGDYISPDRHAGNFMYLDPTLSEPMDFLRNMVLDAVRGYPGLAGIQFDDHYRAPNGFWKLDAMSKAQKYAVMRDWMTNLHAAVVGANPNIHVSYSPSPLQFARNHHNVDWANWLRDQIVQELVPQYYRTTAVAFQNSLDADLAVVPSIERGFVTGIRLSGASEPRITPTAEVNQKLVVVQNRQLTGVSYWFADDLIANNYVPPTC